MVLYSCLFIFNLIFFFFFFFSLQVSFSFIYFPYNLSVLESGLFTVSYTPGFADFKLLKVLLSSQVPVSRPRSLIRLRFFLLFPPTAPGNPQREGRGREEGERI
uniref:Uncharacterized protein n=1 Tax=Mustela putorius furo TaxID=9669 RepID=M3XWA6_MUSPF